VIWSLWSLDILILAQKLVWFSQIFGSPHHTNQAAARHGALGFPSHPFKIMHWMYQVTWHVFEAVIWSLCWLDKLILAQKLVWFSQIFGSPHRTNHAADARHGAPGFPSQPFKIMHWMSQMFWYVFEAVIWSLCCFYNLDIGSKLVWHGKIFHTPH
jgi:hypothetical protein